MGMRDLTHGFMGGLKGIFVDPIRGAQEEGVTGLVKGARKGVMSALVKPTVGAIDLITRTSQGARNSAGADTTQHTRSRPPRYFGSDKVYCFYFCFLFFVFCFPRVLLGRC
jgi:vacuolar protein sorting-associated protein 13A/C